MFKKVFIAIVLLSLFFVLVGCPFTRDNTGAGPSVVTTAETTKTLAEDILFYSRVYYNLGKINEAQFKSVRDAYDVLYVVQNQMIDARIAYLKLPTDATTEEKYRMAMAQMAVAQLRLLQLAQQLGIFKGEVPIIPDIPIRK